MPIIVSQSTPQLREFLLHLAARPLGVAVCEVSGHTQRRVWQMLDRLASAGVLHRGRLRRKTVRFFTSEVDAATWVKESLARKVPPRSAAPACTTRSGAPWAQDAPMNITAATIITRAAPPQGRMAGQCPPDEPPPPRDGEFDYRLHMQKYRPQEGAP